MSKQTDDIHWYGQKTPESVTLRDYFAAAALQGFMAAHTSGGCLVDDLYAKYAYDLADAMLKQRDLK